MTDVIIKKKRGRKPKIYMNLNKPQCNDIELINTDEENIIYHIPLTINEINNDELDLFIPALKNLSINKNMEDNNSSDNLISNTSLNKSCIINNINKIITHNINITNNTKCWWCKYPFDSIAVQLPENYYNNIFFCIGNFCSYNCCKSYNLDLNNIFMYKRESLLNLLYFLTYSTYIKIEPAPHWLSLEDYGGNLNIKAFRENSLINNKEYTILHPPLISRQMQIEESYKFNAHKEVSIDKINKIYSEIESEYIIKRNQPLNSTQLNLETTMGLFKKKKKY